MSHYFYRQHNLAGTPMKAAEAIQSIRATCHDYRVGHTPESQADSILSSAAKVIQEFEQKLANEAKVLAAGGQVAQIDSMRAVLTAMASVGDRMLYSVRT